MIKGCRRGLKVCQDAVEPLYWPFFRVTLVQRGHGAVDVGAYDKNKLRDTSFPLFSRPRHNISAWVDLSRVTNSLSSSAVVARFISMSVEQINGRALNGRKRETRTRVVHKFIFALDARGTSARGYRRARLHAISRRRYGNVYKMLSRVFRRRGARASHAGAFLMAYTRNYAVEFAGTGGGGGRKKKELVYPPRQSSTRCNYARKTPTKLTAA